jgi:hypothetical protein
VYIWSCKERKDCVGEDWVTYRTGSFAVANFSSLLFQFVIVVMLIVSYVLHSVFTWVISNRELPAFPLFQFPVPFLLI